MTRLLFFATLCTFLTSCVSTQKRPIQTSTQQSYPSNWSITGKFALSNGKENGSGKITYSVSGQNINAKFKAPLGQGSWEIKQDKDKAELLSTRHHPIYGNDAQTLVSQELGWDFPWNSLAYWLRGYKTNAKTTPHKQSIDKIDDNGWIITYSKWINTSQGLLPQKIKAKKPPFSVKLIIYKWMVEK